LPGFGIRKFESGRAFYFVKFAVGSQQRKLSLGPVVPGVLGEKRRRASEILTRARVGQDVVASLGLTAFWPVWFIFVSGNEVIVVIVFLVSHCAACLVLPYTVVASLAGNLKIFY
jgi:hypothetical protein